MLQPSTTCSLTARNKNGPRCEASGRASPRPLKSPRPSVTHETHVTVLEESPTTSSTQAAILDSGGLRALLALAASPSLGARTNSAGALRNLATKNQQALISAGALPTLVQLLAEQHGARANLQAAAALRNLGVKNPTAAVAMADAGSWRPPPGTFVPPQSSILPQPCRGAASSRCLRRYRFSQLRPPPGAVQPLVTLVERGSEGAKEQAAAALCNLTLDNEANQAAVVAARGAAPLIVALTSAAERTREQVQQ